MDRLLGEHDIQADMAAGRIQFQARLEERRKEGARWNRGRYFGAAGGSGRRISRNDWPSGSRVPARPTNSRGKETRRTSNGRNGWCGSACSLDSPIDVCAQSACVSRVERTTLSEHVVERIGGRAAKAQM